MTPREIIALLVHRSPLIRYNAVSHGRTTINDIGRDDPFAKRHSVRKQLCMEKLDILVNRCLKSVTQANSWWELHQLFGIGVGVRNGHFDAGHVGSRLSSAGADSTSMPLKHRCPGTLMGRERKKKRAK